MHRSGDSSGSLCRAPPIVLTASVLKQTVPIPWRASLETLSLPRTDSYYDPEHKKASFAKATKEGKSSCNVAGAFLHHFVDSQPTQPNTALLRLPNLTCVHVNTDGLGVTVGWIEAKTAGGLSKLKEVVYASQSEDEVRFCMSGWVREQR